VLQLLAVFVLANRVAKKYQHLEVVVCSVIVRKMQHVRLFCVGFCGLENTVTLFYVDVNFKISGV